MIKFYFSILSFLFSVLAFGKDKDICLHSFGDADEPEFLEHSVQFRGPQNGFWSYLSDDPQTWIFEVVSEKKSSKQKIDFEKITMLRQGKVEADFTKDIQYLKDGKFTFNPSKIKAYVDDAAKSLRALRAKNPISFPTASEQSMELLFEFKGQG